MEKTVLIAGKELPGAKSFADGFKDGGRSVVVSGMEDIAWNKSSPVSARTFVMQAANESDGALEAVLYFDESFVGSRFLNANIQNCTQIMYEYVLSFQYLTIELLRYFESNAGKIAFIYSPYPKSIVNANPLVKSAGAAFTAFAETLNEKIASMENLSQVLVKVDRDDSQFSNENALALWLAQYFDELDGMKKKPDSKHPASWIKPGSKPSSGFRLFR